VAYLAWFVSAALGVATMIAWHTALLRLYVTLELNKYGVAAFNNTVVIVLALVWLVGLVALEAWYRHAKDFRDLGRRVGQIIFAEIALSLLALVIGRL
jgi:uncharacterized protein HemY